MARCQAISRANQAAEAHFKVTVPETAAATKPYFYRPNTEQPYYDILDPVT